MSGIHLALLGMTYGGSVTVIQSFTATGEWVCPTGVTEVEWLIVAVVVVVVVLLVGNKVVVEVLAVLELAQDYQLRQERLIPLRLAQVAQVAA
jgi:hypothetical protein